ncbi:MAG: hypothetical protein K9H49_17675 [Bacteroidales bacterium]|nr:hypothetical protein [Bacteroidales bacterium]MCF8404096.1 hypothetical protein [Bacteroidales bacterium]
MKIKVLKILILASMVLIAGQSCEKEENETKISSFNSDDSHRTGENCMNCHKAGGEGEGIFTVAGTVYDASQTSTLPNVTVKIYTASNASGSLVASIPADKYGNFYTTESVDFGNSLYTVVDGTTGPKYMLSAISGGACNSCHGSGNRIWAK